MRSNYHYISGKRATARVWFVDADRKASVVATGAEWHRGDTAAFYGGHGHALLPVVTGECEKPVKLLLS